MRPLKAVIMGAKERCVLGIPVCAEKLQAIRPFLYICRTAMRRAGTKKPRTATVRGFLQLEKAAYSASSIRAAPSADFRVSLSSVRVSTAKVLLVVAPSGVMVMDLPAWSKVYLPEMAPAAPVIL